MFFDLNVPIQSPPQAPGQSSSKKGKGKAPAAPATAVVYNPAQLATIEARVDLLVHLGYTVLAFTQTIARRFDAKTHVNTLDGLLTQLRPRPGIVYLKRLTIVLDEESEKGFGFTTANTPLLNAYDLLALTPTTPATLSLACLTHSLPSPLTAHIIALPLTAPRLPFRLKHTLVRTARKNGALFEIAYVGALGGEADAALAAESGPAAKRNWWAAAREVARVTKGRGLLISGGAVKEADLRAPGDIANLITILDVPQDAAHAASSATAKSLVLRAQTRKTYRAVLSEPRVVIPVAASNSTAPGASTTADPAAPTAAALAPDMTHASDVPAQDTDAPGPNAAENTVGSDAPPEPDPASIVGGAGAVPATQGISVLDGAKKRRRDEDEAGAAPRGEGAGKRKKKKKQNNQWAS